MGPELEKVIMELSMRMRMIRMAQEGQSPLEELSERDVFLLQIISEKDGLRITDIAAAYPHASESTISTVLTRLWREKKLISKTISPDNQRTTIVELTGRGKEVLGAVMKQRAERFNALFHAIQVSDEEKQVLMRVLSRARQYLDKYSGADAQKG